MSLFFSRSTPIEVKTTEPRKETESTEKQYTAIGLGKPPNSLVSQLK